MNTLKNIINQTFPHYIIQISLNFYVFYIVRF